MPKRKRKGDIGQTCLRLKEREKVTLGKLVLILLMDRRIEEIRGQHKIEGDIGQTCLNPLDGYKKLEANTFIGDPLSNLPFEDSFRCVSTLVSKYNQPTLSYALDRSLV
jgi:hypothetical protein